MKNLCGKIAVLSAFVAVGCGPSDFHDSDLSSSRSQAFVVNDQQVFSLASAELSATLQSAFLGQLKQVVQNAFASETFYLAQSNHDPITLNSIQLSEVSRKTWSGNANINNMQLTANGEYHQYLAQFELTIEDEEKGPLTFYYSVDDLYFHPSLIIKGQGGVEVNPAQMIAGLIGVPNFITNFLSNRLSMNFKLGADGNYRVDNNVFGEMFSRAGTQRPTDFQLMVFNRVLQPFCLNMARSELRGITYQDCRPSQSYARQDDTYLDLGRAIVFGPRMDDVKIGPHGWNILPAYEIVATDAGWVIRGQLERLRFLNIGVDVMRYEYFIGRDGTVLERRYASANISSNWHGDGRALLEGAMKALERSGLLFSLGDGV